MMFEKLDKGLVELIPELRKFVPPAEAIDKPAYGRCLATDLYRRLQKRGNHTLVVSGGKIDICVLATVLGSVDFGYRVIMAFDALCCSDDKSYGSIMNVLKQRLSIQIEVEETEKILSNWH
jgi:nicotinamidase-related amidase